MKLSELLSRGKVISKEGRLLKSIKLDNGESMKKGETGTVLLDFGNGTYHFEHNDFACTVTKEDFIFI